MLSDKQKEEMLKDSESALRREYFRAADKRENKILSIDEYLSFLEEVQRVFKPFEISGRLTVTKHNRL